ncbi:site-specific integrase [Acuticoccus sediminis]|uniref:site-specific integrase n=1 Tax=Acuticoccus sediminis TaxID=2184697 RepID=UPI001CFC9814|nr:site-specific integrase [Acuticoccus sediminis]
MEGDTELSDEILDLGRFRAESGITDEAWNTHKAQLLHEMRKAARDQAQAVLDAARDFERYDFAHSAPAAPPAPEAPEAVPVTSLSETVEAYLGENRRAATWTSKTAEKKRVALELLKDLTGSDRPVASVSRKDAQEVKKLLLELPTNRNKRPETRNLSARDAAKVAGLPKLDTVTVNSYLSIYQSLFRWAVDNGYCTEPLFAGMRVGKAPSGAPARTAFSPVALQTIYRELVHNPAGLVRKESHKWASLIGMFSGARLNEICQLDVKDVRQQDGIWVFDITDEGDDTKRLKTAAGKRKVPVHDELLRLGLLDFVNTAPAGGRLFPDYTYCPQNGHGRSLSRWFNQQFTPGLGIKSKSHVFHSFRHTIVTRLAQAGVAEPVYQSIVGHERQGVTQQVYLREGFTLRQLKAAIDRFEWDRTT